MSNDTEEKLTTGKKFRIINYETKELLKCQRKEAVNAFHRKPYSCSTKLINR